MVVLATVVAAVLVVACAPGAQFLQAPPESVTDYETVQTHAEQLPASHRQYGANLSDWPYGSFTGRYLPTLYFCTCESVADGGSGFPQYDREDPSFLRSAPFGMGRF